ncbi:hypothetical protein ACF3MZ_14650 [Paenibacillaceae bacterium WGS1546]|uniref:hypothetical protein n=1 Tax=Cohnella sp. WGS1546 TaxID=3366810 RepID=UPI00372D2BAA
MAEEKDREESEPNIAPGIETYRALDKEATDEEKETEDTTEVTRLYLDRTPDA